MVEKDRLVGLISDGLVDDLIARVESFVMKTQTQLRCGIGSSVGVSDLKRSVAEATEALEAASTSDVSTVRYTAVPTVKFLLDTMGSAAVEQIRAHLKPLMRDDETPGDLTATLRAYIAAHGSGGVAADQLSVHRHTVSSRIANIENLIGLSTSDPDDRFLAWLAIRALVYRASY